MFFAFPDPRVPRSFGVSNKRPYDSFRNLNEQNGTPVTLGPIDDVSHRGPCASDGVVPGDPEIRAALISRLRAEHERDDGVLLVEELGLCRGEVFVDVTLVNGSLHGYEIKSDRDSLRRLAHQALVYSAVLDRATLVVGEHHVEQAVDVVPDWWQVLVVHGISAGLELRELRPGGVNEHRQQRALVELLWLDEAVALLVARNAARGFRRRPRPVVWDRVCEVYGLEEIAAVVRDCLRARPARLAARSRR